MQAFSYVNVTIFMVDTFNIRDCYLFNETLFTFGLFGIISSYFYIRFQNFSFLNIFFWIRNRKNNFFFYQKINFLKTT